MSTSASASTGTYLLRFNRANMSIMPPTAASELFKFSRPSSLAADTNLDDDAELPKAQSAEPGPSSFPLP